MHRRAGVIVWRVDLDVPEPVRRRCARWLDREEQERAARLPSARQRGRFVVAHGALREILAAWVNCSPRSLRFVRGPHGKPALDTPRHARGVEFNLSHSEAFALVAVSRRGPVGVDLEYWRRPLAVERMAQRVFSLAERSELAALPGPARQEAFYLGWTRKEAYVKAVGRGVYRGFGGVEVTLTPGRRPGLRLADRRGSGPWRLHDLTVHPDYKAALVTRLGAGPYRYARWNGVQVAPS